MFGGINLALYTVQTCHQQSAHCQIGIAGTVAGPEFKSLVFRICDILGNPDGSASVGQSEEEFHGRFKSGQQPLEGICARIGQSDNAFSVFENTADKVQCLFGKVSIAAFFIEDIFTFLGQHHMKVHTVACLIVNGFGHEGCRQTVHQSSSADDVFHHHRVVADFGKAKQLGFDFLL